MGLRLALMAILVSASGWAFINMGFIKNSGPAGPCVEPEMGRVSVSSAIQLDTEGVGSRSIVFEIDNPVCQATTIDYVIYGNSENQHDLVDGSIVLGARQSSTTLNYNLLDNGTVDATSYTGIFIENVTSASPVKVALKNYTYQYIEDDEGDSPLIPIQVAKGASHTCALFSTGEIKCVGVNSSGQLGDGTIENRESPVFVDDSGTNYIHVSVGSVHTCGVTDSNILKCWGMNTMSQLGDGTTVAKHTPTVIDSGVSYEKVYALGLSTWGLTTAGTLKYWGNFTTSTPTEFDSGVSYSQFSGDDTGNSNYCGITTSNELRCWGTRIPDTLGDGVTFTSAVPVAIDSGETYQKISVSHSHTCGVTTAGVLKCWGGANVLGAGMGVSSNIPLVIDSGVSYQDISTAGGLGACGVTTGNQLKCWGLFFVSATFSEFGLLPFLMDTDFLYSEVSMAGQSLCGLTLTDWVMCYGTNLFGEMGVGSSWVLREPSIIEEGVVSLNHSSGSICTTDASSKVKCFGFREYDSSSTAIRIAPVVESSGVSLDYEDNGRVHCRIDTSQVLSCWGINENGQLGNGTTDYAESPSEVDSGTLYSMVSIGQTHVCAITQAGVLKCWGGNDDGQLGDGSFVDKMLPTVIDSGVSFDFVDANDQSTCAITSSGILKCWGNNEYGQLGDGTKTNRGSPVVIDSGVSYASVSVGDSFGRGHSCGITVSGQLRCWGNNQFSQLGDGSTTERLSPVVIDSGVNYKTVAVGTYSSCGITSSDALKCWGQNNQFMVGDSSVTTTQSTPLEIDSGVFYSDVQIGSNTACATTLSNELKCWGIFSYGYNGLSGLILNPTLFRK